MKSHRIRTPIEIPTRQRNIIFCHHADTHQYSISNVGGNVLKQNNNNDDGDLI